MTTPQVCLQVNQGSNVLAEWDAEEVTRVDEIAALPMRQMRTADRSADPRTLNRGRYWFAVSARRLCREMERSQAEWLTHVEKHAPWGSPPLGAGPVFTDPSCVYCAAVKQ